MRPIKYRQYVDGKWHYWGFNLPILGSNAIANFVHPVLHIDSDQYTGQNDKNGVPIYEGDICEAEDLFRSHGIGFETVGVVEWNVQGCFYDYKVPNVGYCGLCDDSELLVIGNIYENPELLK